MAAVSSQHPRGKYQEDVENMSSHEKIRRVGPVGRGCCTSILATCPQQVARVVLVEFEGRHDTWTNGQHYTADRRPTNQVSEWQAGRGPTRRHPRLERMSRLSGASARLLCGNCFRGI